MSIWRASRREWMLNAKNDLRTPYLCVEMITSSCSRVHWMQEISIKKKFTLKQTSAYTQWIWANKNILRRSHSTADGWNGERLHEKFKQNVSSEREWRSTNSDYKYAVCFMDVVKSFSHRKNVGRGVCGVDVPVNVLCVLIVSTKRTDDFVHVEHWESRI